MKTKQMKIAFAAIMLSTPLAMACAPNGNVNYTMPNDCPTVLLHNFDSGLPNFTSSAVNPGQISGTVNTGTETNPHNGSTATGVWKSSNSSDTMALQFSTTQALDLEGLQLSNYWSTEPNASATWDRIQAKLFVNGLQVAQTGTANSTTFRGWRGNTNGTNSNDYWEFATSLPHTPSSNTISVAAGSTVRLELISTNGAAGFTNNQLVIDSLHITGCAVPEPSSTLLVGLAGLGFIARRRRA